MGNKVTKPGTPIDSTDDLVDEFKTVYKEKGPSDLQSQIPYLEKMADHYQAKNDWPSLLRAHSLYNSCASRDTPTGSDKWFCKAYETQLRYWSNQVTVPSYDQQLQMTATLRENLKDIRQRYKKRLDSYSSCFSNLQCEAANISSGENKALYDKILTEIPRLSQDLNDEIILFSRKIAENAVSICSCAPCQFSVVAMGSLARGETTPYSDLEFMFILEAKSVEIISYFERLAVTMYFLIGNLGETKLRYMAIPELMSWSETQNRYYQHWFDDITMSGFKIDGLGSWSGNIPTGNGEEQQHNHLICTVDELVERYKAVLDSPDEKDSLKGDVTAMLASTVHIFGFEELHGKFRSSIKHLRPNEKRQAANMKMFDNDIQKFDFKPSSKLAHRRDVKSDIYRYPSLLILDLKIVHGLHKSDPWSIIDELQIKNVLSSSAADCLRFSLCCGVYMRLATYFYHNSQKESISVLTSDPKDTFNGGYWFVPRSLLIHLFIHLIPLKEAVVLSQANLNSTINPKITHRTKVNAMAIVDYFCEEYHSAASALSDEYPGDSIRSADRFLEWVFVFSAIETGNYKVAESLLALKIHAGEADACDYILKGRLYKALDQYDLALKFYTKGLQEAQSALNGRDHPTAALCFNNIGHTLVAMGRMKHALEYHNQALEMRLRLYGDADNTNVAASYSNLGSVYESGDDFENASKCYRKALEMRLRIFGGRDHTDIETSYSCLASVLCGLGEYKQASMYYKKALDTRLRIFGTKDTKETGTLYSDMGVVLDYQGYYKEAIEYYRNSLDIEQRMVGKVHDSVLALTYHNIGHALLGLSDYNQALRYSKESLDLWQKEFKRKDSHFVLVAYDNIGRALVGLGDYNEAMKCHKNALEMGVRLYDARDHTNVARSCSSLGSVYHNQNQHKLALEYHNQALEMRLRLLGQRNHKDIASSYYDIGSVFKDENDYKKGLHYMSLALDMWLRIFENDHPNVISATKNIQEMEEAISNNIKQ